MWSIEIKQLCKVYRDKRRRPIVALDNLSLKIKSGEVFGLLGPNGAGKSTTIKTLIGQVRATTGTVRLFDVPVSDPSARQRIGYLPENPAFYDFLTSREYLRLVGRTFGMDFALISKESDRILDLLDLRHAENRPIRGFSKGMVQRLGLAQTLLHNPDLYILDEPMSGLDPLGRALVKQIMLDLKRDGKTVIFSTHVTADVEAVCDRVAIINTGKLLAVNQVSDLLESGIEGYVVHLAGGSEQLCEGFDTSIQASGGCELFVPRGDLNRFMVAVAQNDCEVLLMEPRRRNLEQFFLDLVHREKE